jgi:uncharacterized protein (TIGR03663 family)
MSKHLGPTISPELAPAEREEPAPHGHPGRDWTAQLDVFLQGRGWEIVSWTLLLMAAALRFYQLSLVPMHHDEGVNGYFLTVLFRDGIYRYDPTNYHGPTLYFMALAVTSLNALLFGKAGLSTFAVRSIPALCGTATVWLVLKLRRYLGVYGTLAAAVLVAVSPGMVYFSRYFIHEMLLVFFTLGTVVAVLYYHERARPVYLMLAVSSAAMMFATKETAALSAITMLIAWGLTALYFGITKRWRSEPWEPCWGKTTDAPFLVRAGCDRFVLFLAAAMALFAAVYVLMYSSFGTNFPQGIYDSFTAFQYWAKTGSSAHTHDFFTCLTWLQQEEWASLFLGAAGMLLVFYCRLTRFALFCTLWAIGIFLAYSIMPYKTPWLILNISLPLALIGGCGVEEIVRISRRTTRPRVRIMWLVPVGLALACPLYQSIDLNFFHYDDNSIPYVYAHTQRTFLDLIKQVQTLAQRNTTGENTGMDTGIAVMSPEYWPSPWYLREYRRTGFYGKVVPTQEPIVIVQSTQETEAQTMLGGNYARVSAYDLRPGVTLLLYARRDLAY